MANVFGYLDYQTQFKKKIVFFCFLLQLLKEENLYLKVFEWETLSLETVIITKEEVYKNMC